MKKDFVYIFWAFVLSSIVQDPGDSSLHIWTFFSVYDAVWRFVRPSVRENMIVFSFYVKNFHKDTIKKSIFLILYVK